MFLAKLGAIILLSYYYKSKIPKDHEDMCKVKKWHLYTGLMSLITFALTGQYMEHILVLSEQIGVDGQRMMYRASHMYLFFAGAINFLLGIYWRSMTTGWKVKLHYLASILFLISQPILMVAFLIEPNAVSEHRHITFVGCLTIFFGLLISAGVHGGSSDEFS